MTQDEFREIERQIIDLWLGNEINHSQVKQIMAIICNVMEENDGKETI